MVSGEVGMRELVAGKPRDDEVWAANLQAASRTPKQDSKLL